LILQKQETGCHAFTLILALVFLYEIQDIKRFPSVQDFSSYTRLIKPVKTSDGKWAGKSNGKSATTI
jgi:hypothetical protein